MMWLSPNIWGSPLYWVGTKNNPSKLLKSKYGNVYSCGKVNFFRLVDKLAQVHDSVILVGGDLDRETIHW